MQQRALFSIVEEHFAGVVVDVWERSLKSPLVHVLDKVLSHRDLPQEESHARALALDERVHKLHVRLLRSKVTVIRQRL